MPLMLPHDTKTEITGLTKDNAYHTVGVNAFLQQTGAEGVLVQYVSNNGSWGKGGYRSTGAVVGRDDSIEPYMSCIFIAKLNASGQFDYRLHNSNFDAFILAEFHDGIVLYDSDSWVVYSDSGNSWKDRTVSVQGGDGVEDVECALLAIFKASGSKRAGIRMKGATVEPIYGIGSRTGCFPLATTPCKVDENGQYQTWWGQGFCELVNVFPTEIGYIKKGYGFTGIEEPADETVPTNTDWTDFELKPIVPKLTDYAAVLVTTTSPGGDGGIRANGSTNSEDGIWWVKWITYWPGVDTDRLVEVYNPAASNVSFTVWGYHRDIPEGLNTLIINSGSLTMDSGMLTIG